ncbi:MAG: PAS domain-containing protein, partial [Deltaproteobacteria bacterium]|nr:PAS domain-containing protein [Deltaproteobacteria bacterium]
MMSVLQSGLDGKLDHLNVEFRMLCKDGDWKWILGRGMILDLNAEGKPLRLIGTLTDITQRRQAEADLVAATAAAESANLAKSRFLAAASHDLRQPLQ